MRKSVHAKFFHIDQSTKLLTLFRLIEGQLVDVGSSTTAESAVVVSNVVPLSFQLLKSQIGRESILEIRHSDGSCVWGIGV